MTKNWKKFTAGKKIENFFSQKLPFTYPLASQKTYKLQKKTSAPKREHPALQNVTFLIFSTFVVLVCSPGSGSNSDPDPQPW